MKVPLKEPSVDGPRAIGRRNSFAADAYTLLAGCFGIRIARAPTCAGKTASSEVGSGEVWTGIMSFPDELLDIILMKVAASNGPSHDEATASARNAMLVCKHFRSVLLRCATRATLTNDQQAPPFARCPALRELRLLGGCTRLPWDSPPPRPATPSPLTHLASLTRIDIAPQRFNTTFHAPSLAALARCPNLRHLRLTFPASDSATTLRLISPLTALRDLRVDLEVPARAAATQLSASFFTSLASLEHLRLSCRDCFVDASSLRSMTALRTLSMPSLTLDDAALECLSRLQALERLEAGQSELTDAGMARLAALRALTHLHLSGSQRPGRHSSLFVTGTGMACLASLPRLEHLELPGCMLSEGALGQLSRLGALRRLDFACALLSWGVRWTAAAQVSALTRLTLLSFSGSERLLAAATDATMEQVCRITSLRCLDLTDCTQISNAGFAHLARLPALERLSLSACGRIGDEEVRTLSGIGTLRELDLHACLRITDLGAWQLSRLAALTKLSMSFCTGVTGEGVAALTALSSLEELALEGCNYIRDGDVAQLTALTRLGSLHLPPRVTDAGLGCLSTMTRLTHLGLTDNNGVSDEGLARLSAFAALRSVSLTRCRRVTDAGLAHWGGGLRLRYLNVEGCRGVTEAGLAGLTGLVSLRCRMCRCRR